jgi:hypothetical protein
MPTFRYLSAAWLDYYWFADQPGTTPFGDTNAFLIAYEVPPRANFGDESPHLQHSAARQLKMKPGGTPSFGRSLG